MKNVFAGIVIAIAMMFSALQAIAGESQKEPKWSIEIGGGKASGLDMETSNANKLSNSSVFTVRAGYSPMKYIEIQGEYSNIPGFENQEENLVSGDYKQTQAYGFKTYTINLKLMFPIEKIGITPYIVGGIGRSNMQYDWHKELYFISGALRSVQDTNLSGSGTCYKIGGGVDVKIIKDLFLFAEMSHWKTKITFDYKGKSITDTFRYSILIGGLGIKF